MSRSKKYRVAVDAMGGDHAPMEPVRGAVEAARLGVAEILLVGDEDSLRQELAQYSAGTLSIEIVPSEGVVREGVHPVMALRHHPKASIAVGAALVKKGLANALVTLGSTGAAMASTVLTLGLFEGLERPALGGPFLGLAPKTSVIDLGSNVDCRPSQLVSFGVVGCTFARQFLNIDNPRVALLSVGLEEGKGNRQVKEAYPLLQASGLNFVGNIEGNHLFLDRADVVLCDGFVGNILLKYTEGLGDAQAQYMRHILCSHLPAHVAEEVSSQWASLTNLAEHVGGPLFGVNGVVIIGHGRSLGPAVTNSIRRACRMLEIGLVDSMRNDLSVIRQQIDA